MKFAPIIAKDGTGLDLLIGELVWNFADFATVQGTMRVGGNRKGVLTRDRRPKLAAHVLRRPWKAVPNTNYKP